MSDPETDERLSAELHNADWSLAPPPGFRDQIVKRVTRRRRGLQIGLAGGATAAVAVASVVMWPGTTGPTGSGPASPVNDFTTSPYVDLPPSQRAEPPPSLIAYLSQQTWHFAPTTKTPRLSSREAVARAGAALGIPLPLQAAAHAWLRRAMSLRDGVDLRCVMGCGADPAWLIQFPTSRMPTTPALGPLMISHAVVMDATTGRILFGAQAPGLKGRGSLTSRGYTVAMRIARSEADKAAISLTSASVTVEAGTVHNSNVGQPCTSGTLLRIRLIGRFRIVVSPAPGGPGGPVTVVNITADPDSGLPCLLGVGVGPATPTPSAALLFTY